MIPLKDKYRNFGTDPTLEDQIRIYQTKKIHPWSSFRARGAADKGVESLRFQVSIVSGFKSYPSRPEVY